MDLEEGDIYAPPDPNIKYRLYANRDYNDKGITLLIKRIYLIKDYSKVIGNIKQLISSSPETINVQTDKGFTALQMASECGIKKIVELLLEHNTDPHLQNKYGYTALQLASIYGKKEIVKLLLEHDVNPNLQSKDGADDGESALYLASSIGEKEIVELLLKHGANPNLQNYYGDTALLYIALYWESVEIVELLLEYDADPNLQNKYGDTALHRASQQSNKEIVELLLEHGADPNLQNKNEETALHWTPEGEKEIVELLKEAQITYPIKKAYEQSVFREKENFMKKYANIKIILVNNRLHNYLCL